MITTMTILTEYWHLLPFKNIWPTHSHYTTFGQAQKISIYFDKYFKIRSFHLYTFVALQKVN
jgi:hypothetical protein